MTEFEVYSDETGDKWVAFNLVNRNVIGTYSTKKKALNKAQGKAQGYADRHDVAARIDVSYSDGRHQKTLRVNPSR